MVNWPELVGATPPIIVTGRVWRVVENQQQVATTTLVDDLAEQVLLEALLETSKPACLAGCERLHYLLKTPFRYPPLRWGSRFGSQFEPGIFYAAHNTTTALAETAFYRLLFLNGMQKPPDKLISQHLMFAVRCYSDKGIKLQQPPFQQHTQLLADPASYQHSQALGSELRQQGYQAIEFVSARETKQQINMALLAPQTLRSREPEKTLRLLAQTSQQGVSFKIEEELLTFPIDQFLLKGQLPNPS